MENVIELDFKNKSDMKTKLKLSSQTFFRFLKRFSFVNSFHHTPDKFTY